MSFCGCLARNEGMILINHPLWCPLRRPLGSFPAFPTEQQVVCLSRGCSAQTPRKRRPPQLSGPSLAEVPGSRVGRGWTRSRVGRETYLKNQPLVSFNRGLFRKRFILQGGFGHEAGTLCVGCPQELGQDHGSQEDLSNIGCFQFGASRWHSSFLVPTVKRHPGLLLFDGLTTADDQPEFRFCLFLSRSLGTWVVLRKPKGGPSGSRIFRLVFSIITSWADSRVPFGVRFFSGPGHGLGSDRGVPGDAEESPGGVGEGDFRSLETGSSIPENVTSVVQTVLFATKVARPKT